MNCNTERSERNRLADFGYYSAFGIGSTDSDRHVRADACNRSQHAAAIHAYQEFNEAALSYESMLLRSCPILIDGIWGDIGRAELLKTRCGVADVFTEREKASQNNWPEACRHSLLASHKPGMTLPGLDGTDGVRQMMGKAINNWMGVIDINITIVGDWPNTHLYIEAVRLSGSTLAEQYLANGQCSSELQGRFDSDRRWDRKRAAGTASHELGHFLGLRHSRSARDLMYAQLTEASMDSFGAPTSGDVAAALNLGYAQKPITPPPPTDPPVEELDTVVVVTRANGEVITVRGREV